MATAPENACMGLGYVLGTARERTRMVAADILIDALMGSNEAPLKRALLDADLADDAQAFLADALLQPFAVIQLKGLKEGAAERFKGVVDDTLRRLADGGLDHALVEASLSRAEFVMRERDFGMADGVALSMAALSGWLYDDDLATSYLKYEEDFAFLRRALEEGYFEQLVREAFLENGHMAEVEVRPVAGDEDAFEAERLAAAEAGMGPQDYERVADEEAALRRLQEEPDPPEALATLPRLSVDDLGEAPEEPAYGLDDGTPVPCLRHRIPTRGIAYAYRYFDLARLSFDELPYVTVLAIALGKLGTAEHTAAEVDTLVQSRLGNLKLLRRGPREPRRPFRPAPRHGGQRLVAFRERGGPGRPAERGRALFRPARPAEDQGRAHAEARRHGAGLRGRRQQRRPGPRGVLLPARRRGARAAGRHRLLPLPQGPAGPLRRARRRPGRQA